MNPLTVGGIVIATAGTLILGMAGLIKTMVLGKLDELLDGQRTLTHEMHALDIRLTRLEAEHCARKCEGDR